MHPSRIAFLDGSRISAPSSIAFLDGFRECNQVGVRTRLTEPSTTGFESVAGERAYRRGMRFTTGPKFGRPSVRTVKWGFLRRVREVAGLACVPSNESIYDFSLNVE